MASVPRRVAPAFNARWPAAWIDGPSAIGSENGMPISTTSAPAAATSSNSAREVSGSGSPAALAMVRHLRARDPDTPFVLMGYYNTIYQYGAEAFARDAAAAGVDGAIIVDLPPEEDAELADPARAAGLDIVRLATPTSDEARLPAIVTHASGFIYYVAIAGITGTRSADAASVNTAVARLRRFTDLPIAVGFGIRTRAQAAEVAKAADAAVVGTALVDRLALNLDPEGRAKPGLVEAVLADIRSLAAGVRSARTS